MKNNKILMCVPSTRDIPVEVFQSIYSLGTPVDLQILQGSLVDDAREAMAHNAIDNGYDYILWCDSDMTFGADALNQLLADKKDIVCGVFFKRTPPYTPCIYKRTEKGIAIYHDYPDNQLFEIAECGCAFTLMRVKCLKDVLDEYGCMFRRAYPYGEDLSFMKRWQKLSPDNKLYCDSRVKIGHVAQLAIDEKMWKAWRKIYERELQAQATR